MIFKKLKCKHVYLETNLKMYNSFFGGKTKFICINCHKNKWIMSSNIDYLFEKQKINNILDIDNKIKYIKVNEIS